MNTPKISVIVPVYNVEQYLPRCIDSILVQTFKEFELLLINDGSSDKSGKICDEYANKDNRIRVFHKENGGVSSARNLGLDNAQGKWISFIDADDWISPDFFVIEKHLEEVDVIQKGHIIVLNDGREQRKPIKRNILFETQNDIKRFYANKKTNALWDKIISKDIIGNERFNTNLAFGEDLDFFISIFRNINKYSLSQIGYYYYYIRETSAVRILEQDANIKIEKTIERMKLMQSTLSQKDMLDIQQAITCSYIEALLYYHKQMNKLQLNILNKLIDDLRWSHFKLLDIINTSRLLVKILLYKLNLR